MKKSLFKKMNPKFKGQLIQFFDKKGFYIVLFMCVLIIGATAVLVTRNNLQYYSQGGLIDDEPAIDEVAPEGFDDAGDIPTIAGTDPVSIGEGKTDLSDESQKQAAESNNQSNDRVIVVDQSPDKKDNVQSSSVQQKSSEKVEVISRLFQPVDGEVILEYAKDKLVYSKTLEEWRTHNGIDIRSDRGTQVKAAANGVIEKIYKDDGLGITILIDHGNGLKTKYCNLSTDSMVKEKQSIKQGQAISGIGDTAIFEVGDQPHLHFEVIKDGQNIDPKLLLPN
ncbi:MAG: peptidoglycan DD-metalloendopeptidase family protein [Clostridia bacterium]